MMPWGETAGPDPEQLAKRLAEAVRIWELRPSSNNAEAMIQARRRFDAAVGTVS